MKMGRTLLTGILILTAVVTISITLNAYGTNFNVPDQWNWQNTTYKDITGDWTTPARDQRPCGSCWAFAAVAAIESAYDIAYEDPNMNLDLSEQYILSCLSSAGDCDSGSTKLAFYYIKSETPQGNDVNGVVPEWCMPYQAVDWVPCEDKCENWTQNLWPIEDYGEFLLDNNDPDDITFLKTKLIEEGPMVTTMTWTTSFSTWGFSHHNPGDYYPYPGPVGYPNHAVLLVGYKDDPSIPNGGYWICKNSWGTNFGYNGFFNVEYGALRVGEHVIWVSVPNPLCIANFTWQPEYPKTGNPVTFYDNSRGDIESWYWDFGDGNTSTETNPTHTYTQEGTYNVTLTINGPGGKTDTTVKTIVVKNNWKPIAIASPHYLESNTQTVYLDGRNSTDPDGTIVSYEWREDSKQLGTTPTIATSLKPGTHHITLTVTDNDDATATDTVTIIIQPKKIFFDDFQDNGFASWRNYGNPSSWEISRPSEKRLPGTYYSNKVAHVSNCNNKASLTLRYRLDLSGYSVVNLSFWRFVDNDVDSGEYLKVQVFDGSSWDTLFYWTNGQGDDDQWHHEKITLPQKYLTNSFKLRFIAKTSSAYEDIEIDDVLIEGLTGGVNIPPIADAGEDQTLTDYDGDGFETVTLDASSSYDPDGTIVSYEWKEGATQLGTNKVITSSLNVGIHVITLTVTDNNDVTTLDNVTIIVQPKPVNQPPVSDAGNDQVVTDMDENGFENVTLDGSNSYDPDGTIVSYEWKENTTTLGTTAILNITLSVGVHNITLIVTDNEGATAEDNITVVIRLKSVNQPPTADAGADQTLVDNDDNGFETVTLDASSSRDPDGVIVSYEWRENHTLLGNSAVITPVLSIGTHLITLTVTDNDGATSTDNITVVVQPKPMNQPPVAHAGKNRTLLDTDSDGIVTVILDGSASYDPDGTIVSYEWREGTNLLGTKARINATLGIGEHKIVLTVIDNSDEKANDTIFITIIKYNPPPVPRIKTIFFDDFQSSDFVSWRSYGSPNSWSITSAYEKRVPGTFYSNKVAHVSNCNNKAYLTLRYRLDLSGYSTVNLSFWRYVDNDIDSNEYLKVQAFDGNTWDTLFYWTNTQGDDDQWHHENMILPQKYLTTNFKLRFIAKTSCVCEDIQIDDVLLQGVTAGINIPPIANAGEDQTLTDYDGDGFETVTLDASSSYDPDGTIVSYEWKEDTTIIGNSLITTLSLPLGTHTITLVVTDNDGATTIDDVVITINPHHQPPTGNIKRIFFDDFQDNGFASWRNYGNPSSWEISRPSEKRLPGTYYSNKVAHVSNCNNKAYLTLRYRLDLSGYSVVNLSFWRFVDNDVDSGEYLKVQAFDGSSWNTLFYWTHGQGDDDQWHHEKITLPQKYLTNSFKLRFIAKTSSVYEDIQIDDILIEGVKL